MLCKLSWFGGMTLGLLRPRKETAEKLEVCLDLVFHTDLDVLPRFLVSKLTSTYQVCLGNEYLFICYKNICVEETQRIDQ